MKKMICTMIFFTVFFYIFPVTAFSNDFSDRAITAFKDLKKLNDEWRAAFISGDNAAQKEKGKVLADLKDNVIPQILRSLPEEYCADPDTDLLKAFINTLINSTDEYPTYVFAELYACDPDRITKEIMSLKSEDKRKIFEDLTWGFKNITYKIESLPNYDELKEKLNNLKSIIRNSPKK